MRPPPVMILMALLGLAGCSGEPVPAGPDTWRVSTGGGVSWSSGGELMAEILRKADTFCRGKGRQMPVSTRKNSDVAQLGSAELYFPYFRCLNGSDPRLGRPVRRTALTVVIEDRSR